jgi:hypothetical protein
MGQTSHLIESKVYSFILQFCYYFVQSFSIFWTVILINYAKLYAGLQFLPDNIKVPFFKTFFSDMAEIDEPDMAAISFEILKEVNNLRYDDYAIDELQFFVYRVQNIDLQQRCLVISFSLFPLVIAICFLLPYELIILVWSFTL